MANQKSGSKKAVTAPAPTPPTAVEQIKTWTNTWQGLVTLAVPLIALVAYLANLGFKTSSLSDSVSTINKSLDKTSDRIEGVQQNIADINTRLALLNLKFELSRPIVELKSNLGRLRSEIANVQSQHLKLPSSVVSEVQSKIIAVPNDAPDYWATVADFIGFRSLNSVSWTISGNLPNCRDTTPATDTLQQNFTVNGVPQKVSVQMAGFSRCRLTLDSVVDGEWLNRLISEPHMVSFKECVIVYNGGPIVARLDLAAKPKVVDSVKAGKGTVTASVERSITFDDCVFEIAADKTPTEQAKALAKRLLAQNPPKITLPIA
jgi:hypothetical protein